MKNNFFKSNSLFWNYGKLAFRSLVKSRQTTAINITGLVIGLTGCFFIGLFILDELSYDQFFSNTDRIYRVTTTSDKNGQTYRSAHTKGRIAFKLRNELPEVQAATRILPSDETFLFTDDSAFKERIIYTDSSFLKVFGLHLIVGNSDQCLVKPSSLIISEETAVKLFGNNWQHRDVLGKSVLLDGWLPLSITGVFKDFPRQTHLRSHLFASVPSGLGSWMGDEIELYTYVLLHAEVDAAEVNKKLPGLSQTVFPDHQETNTQINLQPLSDIYLFSSLENENATQGNIKNIYGLLLVSIFLIVITVINFANLFTANSFNRLKEIGVRKSMGARQGQLEVQFLAETAMVTIIALCVALFATVLLLPAFNEFTGKHLLVKSLADARVIAFITGLTVMVSLLAGIYPALVLSAKNTVDALKGLKTNIGGIGFRKALIMLQFAISCIMIILSIVAYRQILFITEKPLGFDKENTLAIANPYMLGSIEKIHAFRNELMALPGVEQVSITGYTPSQRRWGNQRMTFPERDEYHPHRNYSTWLKVDENFVNTMGLILTLGRNFHEDHERDKQVVIINEKAATQFKLRAPGRSPIGSELSYRDKVDDLLKNFEVVGVVADFNFGSLHEPVKPVIMELGYHRFEMVLRLSFQYAGVETIQQVEKIWKSYLPLIPFEYSYIKARFNNLHRADITASKLFSGFCILTIFMSAMGLFSIVTYSLAHRTKEIGIRKLLGATERSIVVLVANDFLKLIIWSYAVAIPIALILSRNWLADFAYKTEISWTIFALTGFILMFVTVLTLAYQALKAARVNPIDNLKHE